MTEQEIFAKNLILRTEFDRYVLEHPDFAEKIPDNAQVVLLPAGDQELCRINKEIAEQQREEGQLAVYIHIGAVAPQISRLSNVRIEVKAA